MWSIYLVYGLLWVLSSASASNRTVVNPFKLLWKLSKYRNTFEYFIHFFHNIMSAKTILSFVRLWPILYIIITLIRLGDIKPLHLLFSRDMKQNKKIHISPPKNIVNRFWLDIVCFLIICELWCIVRFLMGSEGSLGDVISGSQSVEEVSEEVSW